MSQKEFDLLVIGEINPDLVLMGEDVTPAFGQAEKLVEAATLTMGSSSVIVACGAARLGLKTVFVGVVGDDLFGHYMLDALRERGVDTSACRVDATLTTGFSVILSEPADRAILTYPGSISSLRYADIDLGLLARARHLHLSSYFLLENLRPDIGRLFSEAKRQGLTTSLDTNWDPSGHWAGLTDVLDYVDILLPNEAEARALTGTSALASALDRLGGKVPLVAVKLGAAGAVARQGELELRSVTPKLDVSDTTGAGDSFDAGFLYGFLNGWVLGQTLAFACACGALSTRAAGGTAAQATLKEAEAVSSLLEV